MSFFNSISVLDDYNSKSLKLFWKTTLDHLLTFHRASDYENLLKETEKAIDRATTTKISMISFVSKCLIQYRFSSISLIILSELYHRDQQHVSHENIFPILVNIYTIHKYFTTASPSYCHHLKKEKPFVTFTTKLITEINLFDENESKNLWFICIGILTDLVINNKESLSAVNNKTMKLFMSKLLYQDQLPDVYTVAIVTLWAPLLTKHDKNFLLLTLKGVNKIFEWLEQTPLNNNAIYEVNSFSIVGLLQTLCYLTKNTVINLHIVNLPCAVAILKDICNYQHKQGLYFATGILRNLMADRFVVQVMKDRHTITSFLSRLKFYMTKSKHPDAEKIIKNIDFGLRFCEK